MSLTLPQSLGGIKTYDSGGAVIMRSTNDEVEIYVALHVNATTVIEGATTIHDTLDIDGDTTIGGTLTVDGTTLLGGTLTLTADLDADGFTITGARLTTGTGNIIIEDDTISLGGSSLTFDGLGAVFSDRVVAANIQTPGSLTTSGTFSHAGAAFGIFGASPGGKPTITGSRGGNAALADLLAEGAGLGFWTDSTSA
jgi:hypothetical protein